MRRVSDGVFEFEDDEIDILVGALRFLASKLRQDLVEQPFLEIIYDRSEWPTGQDERDLDASDFDEMADALLGEAEEAPDDLSQMLNEVAPKRKP